jgi:hypothetical protein
MLGLLLRPAIGNALAAQNRCRLDHTSGNAGIACTGIWIWSNRMLSKIQFNGVGG